MTIRLRLSASQFKTYKECARRWSWNKLAGFEHGDTPATLLGTELHAQIESYLQGGAIDYTKRTGAMVSAGLEFMPKPLTPGMFVERGFNFPGNNADYSGRVDCELDHEAPKVVIDWKSCSDFKWQKTPEQLRYDPQPILYASQHFYTHPNDESVKVKFVYFRTRGANKSQVSEIELTQQETWDRFVELEQTAKEMAEIADKASTCVDDKDLAQYILTLPPTESACGDFGGCPHACRCTDLGPLTRLKSFLAKEKNRMSLSQFLKKPDNTAPPPLAPPAIVPPAINPPEQYIPVPVGEQYIPVSVAITAPPNAPASTAASAPTPAAPATGNVLLSRLGVNRANGANTNGAAAPPATPATSPSVALTSASLSPSRMIHDLAAFKTKYPDVDPDTLTVDQVLAVNKGEPPTPTSVQAPAAVQAFAAATAALPSSSPATEPKKRGRPKKVTTDVVAAAVSDMSEQMATAVASVAPVARLIQEGSNVEPSVEPNYAMAQSGRTSSSAPNISTVPRTETKRHAKIIRYLYIDCRPSCEYEDGTEIIALAKERLLAENVADYRNVEYGKGHAMLADAVEAVLASSSQDAVVLDSGMQEYSAVSYVFIRRAEVVVR